MNAANADAFARVYALIGPDGTRCYVGSTRETIHQRLVRHKWRALTGERPHSRLHNLMSQLGPANFTVELIDTVPIAERIQTEAQHIRVHGILNMNMPGRSAAQRRAEARERRRAEPT